MVGFSLKSNAPKLMAPAKLHGCFRNFLTSNDLEIRFGQNYRWGKDNLAKFIKPFQQFYQIKNHRMLSSGSSGRMN
jgi:hypothetical protein